VTASARTTTMTAIVQDVFGTADVLALREVAVPAAGEGEVLVRVHAAGVDRGVWHLVAGMPYAVRLAGYGLRTPTHPVPGADLAGRVEAVGPGVTRFAPGDEVFGTADGSFAEYALAREDTLAAMPATVGFTRAAAVPTSAVTALQALRDHGRVAAGQRVLVIGASGGVGTFAVQLARAFGATVDGVAGPSKVDLVRSLGAEQVLDHSRADILDTGHRYDLVLDIGGNRRLRLLRRALTPTGTLVIVGGETGGRWLGGTQRQLRAMAISPFVRQRLGTFIATPRRADLEFLAGLLERGEITPVVERTFPLAQAAAALRHLESGRTRGKVVLTV